jgi:hypothetical protein
MADTGLFIVGGSGGARTREGRPRRIPMMKKHLLILAVALLAVTVGASQTVAAPGAVAAKKCKKKKHKKCKKKKAGPQGPQGPPGVAGVNGTDGSPGTAATTHGTLTISDFVTTAGGPLFLHNPSNGSVSQTPDGIEFGPYANGGLAGGSVEFTGLNGQPLSAVQSLVYFMRYTADNDTGGGGAPYLRIFLEDDGHDLIFSPNSQTPNPDTAQGPFHTWVGTSGTWRYDDDPGGTNPELSFAAQKAAHGTEVISGIYITVGNSAGTNLSGLLREWQINATTYSFGL